MEKNRQSNFELLRFFSIFVIIVHHFAYHNELYELDNINRYFGIVLFSFGKMGVNLFVILTGYFMITKKISLFKIIKLWLQVFFYSVTIATVVLIFKGLEIKEYIKFFLPITFNKYWFFSSYIFLYMSIPILNMIFSTLDKKKYKFILSTITFLFVVWFSIIYRSAVFSLNDILADIVLFSYLYILGGYIKRFGISFLEKKSICMTFFLIVFVGVIYEFVLILSKKYSNLIPCLEPVLMYYARQNSIFVMALSILVFYFFKKINIGENSFINFISQGIFGIYLLQSHPLFGGKLLYKDLLNSSDLYGSKKIVLYAFGCSILIIMAGIVIDLLRIMILEKIILNKKVKRKIELLEDKIVKKW